MSHIGKKPIEVPSGVEVKIEEQRLVVKGQKGTLEVKIPHGIKVETSDGKIVVSPVANRKSLAAFWGLTRALTANAVKGVSEGFTKQLEFQGVGYRAAVKGDELELNLGFSHPVTIKAPAGIEFKVEKNMITVSGANKEMVGQVAAKIRKLRKPEPYKGSGIKYVGEKIIRKAGKKAVGAGA